MAPDTSKLVLEPISVVMPARMAAKDSGIISRLGANSKRRAIDSRMGMKMMTMGVLLTKALVTSTVAKATMIASTCRSPVIARNAFSAQSRAPARDRPWPSTRSAITATSAGFTLTARKISVVSAAGHTPPTGCNYSGRNSYHEAASTAA